MKEGNGLVGVGADPRDLGRERAQGHEVPKKVCDQSGSEREEREIG
jgi:hypothetical protein